MRLISATGEQLGVVPLTQAIEIAAKDTMDVVEVAPDAVPPVCKIMDYRRHVFEMKRRLKESRKKAKALEMKELKLRPNIDPHDYSIKVKHAMEFLEKGHKVKVTMRYRPREMRHFEIGTQVLDRMAVDVAAVGEVDAGSRSREGARMQSMVIGVKKK